MRSRVQRRILFCTLWRRIPAGCRLQEARWQKGEGVEREELRWLSTTEYLEVVVPVQRSWRIGQSQRTKGVSRLDFLCADSNLSRVRRTLCQLAHFWPQPRTRCLPAGSCCDQIRFITYDLGKLCFHRPTAPCAEERSRLPRAVRAIRLLIHDLQPDAVTLCSSFSYPTCAPAQRAYRRADTAKRPSAWVASSSVGKIKYARLAVLDAHSVLVRSHVL